jgi:hypothetical protein
LNAVLWATAVGRVRMCKTREEKLVNVSARLKARWVGRRTEKRCYNLHKGLGLTRGDYKKTIEKKEKEKVISKKKKVKRELRQTTRRG